MSNDKRRAHVLAMINLGIWSIAIIAMVFIMQQSPSAKGLFPILGGGVTVGIALLSTISKSE
jgi:hypothetical protein